MFKMLISIIFLSFVLSVFSMDTREAIFKEHFESFKVKYSKSYSSDFEEAKRFNIFLDNMKVAELRNRLDANVRHGITKFSDLTEEEFRNLYLTKVDRVPDDVKSRNLLSTEHKLTAPLPTSWDWRTKGAVTPVYDQGQCGSCWAFSTTENTESVWFLAGNPLVSLSPQELVDCSWLNLGCNGGNQAPAYNYIISYGLDTWESYPYRGDSSWECAANEGKIGARIKNYKWATSRTNETLMMVNLVGWAPLSICLDAETWSSYTGGIVSSNCGSTLDHCVQLVGYGTANGVDYWLVRNSWGTDWGEEGYIRVIRDKNMCGIADSAASAVV